MKLEGKEEDKRKIDLGFLNYLKFIELNLPSPSGSLQVAGGGVTYTEVRLERPPGCPGCPLGGQSPKGTLPTLHISLAEGVCVYQAGNWPRSESSCSGIVPLPPHHNAQTWSLQEEKLEFAGLLGRFRLASIPSEPTQLIRGSSGCSIKLSDENFRGEKYVQQYNHTEKVESTILFIIQLIPYHSISRYPHFQRLGLFKTLRASGRRNFK